MIIRPDIEIKFIPPTETVRTELERHLVMCRGRWYWMWVAVRFG